jgi:hypothetical protein
MKIADRTSPWNSQGREIVTLEDRAAGQQTQHSCDPAIDISEHLWSDEAARDLVEEWLVPSIVDRIVRDLLIAEGTR